MCVHPLRNPCGVHNKNCKILICRDICKVAVWNRGATFLFLAWVSSMRQRPTLNRPTEFSQYREGSLKGSLKEGQSPSFLHNPYILPIHSDVMPIGFELAIKEMRRTDATILYELITVHLGWVRGDGTFKPAARFKDGVPYSVGLSPDGRILEKSITEGEFEKAIRLMQQGRPLHLGVKEYRFYKTTEVAKILIDIRTGKVSAEEVLKFIRTIGAY